MNGDGELIPPRFWKSLTEEEFRTVCETGELNRKLCRRLWAMEGRTEKPPLRLRVLLNAEDVMRVFPSRDRQH